MINILVLPGDGIGKEVSDSAVKVLEAIGKKYEIAMDIDTEVFGGKSYEKYGEPCPNQLIERAKTMDAIFLGAVGHPKFDVLPSELRPEKGLLKLRKELDLYCNIRPVKYYSGSGSKIWREERVKNTNITFVRELSGGAYYGERYQGEDFAYDRIEYSKEQIERIVRKGFEVAQMGTKKLHSIDKSNVLATSKMWRACVNDMHKEYPEVEVIHQYVDNAAAQLMSNPEQFDVLLTENMFGDILSDQGAILSGSLGMLPSASLGGAVDLYEPGHGSAPDIMGKNLANPIGSILSIALMFKYTFDRPDIAEKVEKAVESVLQKGYCTMDISSPNCMVIGTKEMTEKVIVEIE
ncbi:MAG: 3-isopropylmalate dehydrogenase [Clostridia bacterium]|nr:3-isopropylmalate dehydrogenase [Clostridia bacterium]